MLGRDVILHAVMKVDQRDSMEKGKKVDAPTIQATTAGLKKTQLHTTIASLGTTFIIANLTYLNEPKLARKMWLLILGTIAFYNSALWIRRILSGCQRVKI